MDVRRWSLDKLMSLPDHCFGRRFGVYVSVMADSPGAIWDISEIALPDQCVLWEVFVWMHGGVPSGSIVRLALGDQLPTATVMMDGYEPLLHGWGVQGPEPRAMQCEAIGSYHLVNLRMPLAAQGRRLVVETTGPATGMQMVDVAIVISSLPREISNCLAF